MKLQKRDCGIQLKLVPYGAGWTDVYLSIGKDELYFIITSVCGHPFSKLPEILYHLHPHQNDPQRSEEIQCWDGVCRWVDGRTELVQIVEEYTGDPAPIRPIPHQASMHWDEEGASSHWTFTREPTDNGDFMLRIDICIRREGEKTDTYEVRYRDFCYAVAKACTEVLKSHGLYGYHYSTYTDDLNLRHLLFLKAIALDCPEVRELKSLGKGMGERTDFEKELELLLFDM